MHYEIHWIIKTELQIEQLINKRALTSCQDGAMEPQLDAKALSQC